jgi:hypothetical protein
MGRKKQRPSGWISREMRFFIPQSMVSLPFRDEAGVVSKTLRGLSGGPPGFRVP